MLLIRRVKCDYTDFYYHFPNVNLCKSKNHFNSTFLQIFRKSIPADLPKSIKIEVFFTLQCCHCESSFIRNSLYEFAPTTRTYSFGVQYSVLFESVSPCTTNFTCFPIPHPPSCGSWPFLRVVNRDCLWPLGQASPAQ